MDLWDPPASMAEDIIYFGWLWKKGSGFMSAWRRRYFELNTSGTLNYFTDENHATRKGKILLTNIRAAILPSMNPKSKQTTPYALYLYTKGRTYQLEYGGEDQNTETAKGYLGQWFTHVLYASGREEQEQESAKKIQRIFALYCAGKNKTVTMVPPSTSTGKNSNNSKNSKNSKTKKKTFGRPTSRDENSFRSATNLEWESQGKLLLLRPRTGANSILRRSPSVRNRGLCWQVLLECLTYGSSSSTKVQVSSATTATSWAKSAKKAKAAYQQALEATAMPTTPPTTATTTTATTTATTSANISALLFDTEDAQFLPTSTIETKHSSSSSSALRVKSLARNPASIDPLSSTTAPDPQQTMNALKEEIANDVNRTFPENPFFQEPHVKKTMSRILLTWSQQDEKSRTISYRQGMNSLLAVLLFVHKRDASSKARAVRIHLTKLLDVSLVNAVHAEYLRTKISPTPYNSLGRPIVRGWLNKPDFKRKDQQCIDGVSDGTGINRTLAVVNEKIKGDSFHKRWFVLDPSSQTLRYYKKREDERDLSGQPVASESSGTVAAAAAAAVAHGKKIASKHAIRVIDLSAIVRIRISSVIDAPNKTSTFDLVTRDRIYTLSAPNASFMAHWVEAIVTTIHDVSNASSSSSRTKQNNRTNSRPKKNDDSKIRAALQMLESLEMVESQTYTAFCALMNTERPSSVGPLAIVDLFDHYTEFDPRRKEDGNTRFVSTARRTFLADAASQESTHDKWLAIRKLSDHMQHVLLKDIDPELHRCMQARSIQPQLYALRWMRCLFSNVLTAVESEGHQPGHGSHGNHGNHGNHGPKKRRKSLLLILSEEFKNHGHQKTAKTIEPATPGSPLAHVIAVFDAMLGCRERMFDFIEAMCIAMLISMRTSLLNSDENGMLVLLMRYGISSITEMRPSLSNADLVQGLINMALELMEHPNWPDHMQTIDLNGLMAQVWDAPMTLISSTVQLKKQQSASGCDGGGGGGGSGGGGGGGGAGYDDGDGVEKNTKMHKAKGDGGHETRGSQELKEWGSGTTGGARKGTPSTNSDGSVVEMQYVDPEAVKADLLDGSQMPTV